jgi:hypothetical protein
MPAMMAAKVVVADPVEVVVGAGAIAGSDHRNEREQS